MDLFSKQAYFIPCKGLPSARKLSKMFVNHIYIYRLHGVPRRIISDRGVQFTEKFWREFIQAIGSSQDLSSGFHAQTSGLAVKTNQFIGQYLRCYVNYQQTNWADLLLFAEVAYNNAVHSSTGLTPFQINTGVEFVPMPELPRHPSLPSMSLTEWMDAIKDSWENTKKALNKAAQNPKDIS
uniref:Integrase catalytic domain-containing protein n=1 Tax=Micrurus carvalhoi TaxID=3147026 RepID=A0A2H6MZC8_9SAUR